MYWNPNTEENIFIALMLKSDLVFLMIFAAIVAILDLVPYIAFLYNFT